MEMEKGSLVTWVTCQCGHDACVPYLPGLAADIVPRLRRGQCGAKGFARIVSGYKANANPLDGARASKRET